VAAAPAVGAARLVSEGTKDTGRAYYRTVSQELTNAWHSNMQRPLTIVAGTFDLALAVTFYSSDHPDSLQGFRREQAPWVTDTRLKQEGWASICFSNDEDCLARTAELARDASNVVHLTYTGKKSWFGVEATPIEFKFLLVPPQL
jgi:hypothetical protein